MSKKIQMTAKTNAAIVIIKLKAVSKTCRVNVAEEKYSF